MKYDLTARIFAVGLGMIIKPTVKDAKIRKAIGREYRAIVERASDIGRGNMLQSAYDLCAYYIAMNRNTGLSYEENADILDQGMRSNRLFHALMGNADGYFSEKKMAARREWSKKTHERKYANDWVVDVLENQGDFVFGLDYSECGVCKLCRDEGCPEAAKYMCRLDFTLVEIIGIHLKRTMTLAEGGSKCDFRFYR